jgi:hypothetical protein
MSTAANEILKSFEELPREEQRAVATSILRRIQQSDYAEFTDDELTAIAEETFLHLDREESSRDD